MLHSSWERLSSGRLGGFTCIKGCTSVKDCSPLGGEHATAYFGGDLSRYRTCHLESLHALPTELPDQNMGWWGRKTWGKAPGFSHLSTPFVFQQKGTSLRCRSRIRTSDLGGIHPCSTPELPYRIISPVGKKYREQSPRHSTQSTLYYDLVLPWLPSSGASPHLLQEPDSNRHPYQSDESAVHCFTWTKKQERSERP